MHILTVEDAGLGQNGVLVHGIGQGDAGGLHHRGHHFLKVGAVLGAFHRGVGGQAADGEDGALGGLHNGLVGRFHAGNEGGGELRGGGGLQLFETLRKAAEEEGGDHAGVAPGAPQQGGGDAVGHVGGGAGGVPAQLGGRGAHGQAHVGAGVAVGDGEHVQLIDGLLVGYQGVISAQDHVLKRDAVYILSQNSYLYLVF